MKIYSALASGTIFGFGLALSGMTDPANIIGFLDIRGQWNPSLAFVMMGGLAVTIVTFQLVIPNMQKPVLAELFVLPETNILDGKLVLGACLFGIGWGLSGLCPGPAIAGLAYFDWHIVLFVLVMVVGMYSGDWMTRLLFTAD
ncbi:MAG: YeeE/YedE family protein [Pseudomonadales bacterium]|nr:YeeE/YedE family protein [Pseudomonadales bacterium]